MKSEKETIQLIDKKNFETEINGKAVSLFVLKNGNGLVSEITNYGGRVVTLWVPDKNGDFEDVVLGHDSMKGYLGSNDIYLGATVGRYANRIGKGKFTLNGVDWQPTMVKIICMVEKMDLTIWCGMPTKLMIKPLNSPISQKMVKRGIPET